MTSTKGLNVHYVEHKDYEIQYSNKTIYLLHNYFEINLKIPWKRNKSLVWSTQSDFRNQNHDKGKNPSWKVTFNIPITVFFV